jgi:hypothetical protein
VRVSWRRGARERFAEDNWQSVLPIIGEPGVSSLRALHMRWAPRAEQDYAVVQVRRGISEKGGRRRASSWLWLGDDAMSNWPGPGSDCPWGPTESREAPGIMDIVLSLLADQREGGRGYLNAPRTMPKAMMGGLGLVCE